MRIWIDENYNILKSDNNNIFGKGNNLNDRIEVLLPTNFSSENILPAFKFRLASNRTLGAYTHNETPYEVDNEYTAFPFVLNDTILSVKGELEITIELQFYNKSTQLVRTKNLTAKAIVTDNIVLNDEIYIVGNEGEIIQAVRENMDALNKRQTLLERTLVNNETISVDRVNGVIYGKQFYPKAKDSCLGHENRRFASAYVDFIVDNNGIVHDTRDILDKGNITYADSPSIDSSSITIGTFTFGNISITLRVPTNMITATNKTTGKGYLVAVDGQGTPTSPHSNANLYIENDTLHAKEVTANVVAPEKDSSSAVGTNGNAFSEGHIKDLHVESFNNKTTANKSLVEDTEITKLKGLPSQEALNRTIEDLQSQIDGINAGQNLADIVGTYADLASYNKTNLKENDKIQVLVDEEHEGDSSVYNWNGTSFVYIGSYGSNSYTKTEVDQMHDELDERMIQHEAGVEADVTAFKGEVNTKIAQNNTTVNTFRTEILDNVDTFRTEILDNVTAFKGEIFEYVDEAVGNIPALLDVLIGTTEEV